MKVTNIKIYILKTFLLWTISIGIISTSVWAELVREKDSVIEDSEEPFSDRIYYYDMEIDNEGKAHVIYALPQPDRINSHIIYAVENGNTWNKQILSQQGKYIPTGVQISLDSTGIFHVIYIKGTNDFDSSLTYRTISREGIPSPEQNVGMGGWRSRLEINPVDDKPYIMREFEGGLNILIPQIGGGFIAKAVDIPAVPFVRLAGVGGGSFQIDETGGFHVIYGDSFTTATHPVYGTNPRHYLWYANSDSANGPWTAIKLDDIISDPSERLRTWELEFWTDMTIVNGIYPIIITYAYNFVDMSIIGTYGRIFRKDMIGWHTVIATRNQPRATAGGENGIAQDLNATTSRKRGFHGVWDNSPPEPFEFESSRGGIMYRFSPDGINWMVHQLVASYSAEGRCVVKIYNDKLNILVLGDFTDTKLRFLRYAMHANNLMELYPYQMLHKVGESVPLNGFVHGNFVGDWYALIIGRYTGSLWFLNSAFTWQQIASLSDLAPFFSNFSGIDFNAPVFNIPPFTAPFPVQDIYDFYSVVATTGTNVFDRNWVTPLFYSDPRNPLYMYIYANWPWP